MARILYRGGTVHTVHTDRPATALVTEDGTIAWVGDGAPAGDFDAVVPLDGALVTPAFVDAHVHVTATGLALDGLDLTGCPSLAEALRRLAGHAAARPADIVIGHGWDESRWPEGRAPTAAELDAATGGAACYLSRTDAHSAVVSAALLARAPDARGLPGYDPSGHLRLESHQAIRRFAYGALRPDQRRRIQRRALAEAARRGIGHVHENGTPVLSGEDDLAALLALARAEPLPEVVGYWGELGAYDLARRHGLPGLAGDLLADGSIGSHTACLAAPYADAPGADTPYADAPGAAGHAYLTAEQVAGHVAGCTRAGLQAGFHAIGDGALRTVLDGFESAAREVGIPAVRAAGHRIEHVEMPDAAMIGAMARLGILASVQPIADAFWGGPGGMYERRLGPDRARAMNPLRSFLDAGVPVALSSDAPIMPLGPWRAVRAAVEHHVPEQRLTPAEAVRAHAAGGHRAAGPRADPLAGRLVPGAPASLAVWECPDGLDPATGLPVLAGGAAEPECVRTVVRGRTIHGPS